jgi:hypothetical protein
VVSLTETPKGIMLITGALWPQSRSTLRGVPGLGLAGVHSTDEATRLWFSSLLFYLFSQRCLIYSFSYQSLEVRLALINSDVAGPLVGNSNAFKVDFG